MPFAAQIRDALTPTFGLAFLKEHKLSVTKIVGDEMQRAAGMVMTAAAAAAMHAGGDVKVGQAAKDRGHRRSAEAPLTGPTLRHNTMCAFVCRGAGGALREVGSLSASAYSAVHVLRFTDRLSNGFYDGGRGAPIDDVAAVGAIKADSRMPSLAQLLQGKFVAALPRELLYVDSLLDPCLAAAVKMAQIKVRQWSSPYDKLMCLVEFCPLPSGIRQRKSAITI